MSNKRIGYLPAIGTLTDDCQFYGVNDAGESHPFTLGTLNKFVRTQGGIVSRNLANRGALVTRDGNYAVPQATNLLLPWTNYVYNDEFIWDSKAPTKLFVPRGVTRVRLQASVEFSVDTTGVRLIFLRRNGSESPTGLVGVIHPPSGLVGSTSCVSGVVDATHGDYFEFLVSMPSTSPTRNIVGSEFTWACMEIVEGAQ